MSNTVYPTLLGLTFKVGRYPRFKTKTKEAVSGSELRSAFQAYPVWRYVLTYEFLRDDATNNELNKLLALFLVMRGSWDSFLFTDPDAFQVTDFQFATCDGTTLAFQLTRSITDGSQSFVEPVENKNVVTTIKRNNVTLATPADYTVGATGIVTFAAAGTNGHSLKWTGSYYNRCRFLMDEAQFDKFMDKLWTLGKCDLLGAPGNKV